MLKWWLIQKGPKCTAKHGPGNRTVHENDTFLNLKGLEFIFLK